MSCLLWISFCGSLLLLLSYTILLFLDTSDITKVVHSHYPGPCRYIKNVEHGSEDLAILPSGMAILSTGLVESETAEDIKSTLMSFNFSDPAETAKVLQITGFKGNLNPHGLSLFEDQGTVYVYVINHPPFDNHPPADVVLKFKWLVHDGVLVYEKTFTDPEFRSLNDLMVTETDKFYVSNMWIFESRLMREIETLALFWLPLQNVIYFDGTKGGIALSAVYGANGINVSPDKKFLYLSEVHAKRVSSYRIESPGELTLVDRKYIGSIVDNIDVHRQTGELWLGCHPVGFRIYMQPFFDLTAPSQVVRLGVQDGKFTTSKEIFADDGSHLAASSVAAHYNGSVLIGSVNNKVLLCKCRAC